MRIKHPTFPEVTNEVNDVVVDRWLAQGWLEDKGEDQPEQTDAAQQTEKTAGRSKTPKTGESTDA